MDIIGIALTGVIGGIVVKAADKIFSFFLMKYFPDKYILKQITYLDDKIIDPYKKKYPESGKLLEKKISKMLSDSIKIINDK